MLVYSRQLQLERPQPQLRQLRTAAIDAAAIAVVDKSRLDVRCSRFVVAVVVE